MTEAITTTRALRVMNSRTAVPAGTYEVIRHLAQGVVVATTPTGRWFVVPTSAR